MIPYFSPNTPGLRSLQSKEELQKLLAAVNRALNSLPAKPPLLLKLAPDLTLQEIKDIVTVITKKDTKVDGLIISNTTTERPSLENKVYAAEVGGLSGKPLANKSTEMIKTVYKLTKGKVFNNYKVTSETSMSLLENHKYLIIS